MEKWEYMQKPLEYGKAGIAATLNELGAKGWELVTIYHFEGTINPIGIFKRKTISGRSLYE